MSDHENEDYTKPEFYFTPPQRCPQCGAPLNSDGRCSAEVYAERLAESVLEVIPGVVEEVLWRRQLQRIFLSVLLLLAAIAIIVWLLAQLH